MRRLLVLLGADENKIRVIRIGIDVASIKPMAWEERIKKGPSIVFLGRLTEKKHPIALLYAFNIVLTKIPEAKLTIIGDGPLKNEVVNTIKRLNLENSVSLLGSLPREKSFPILNAHWVFAQHSVTSKTGDKEGYALSPAEAAAHELPVVSTLHNGIPEHVIDGHTGYLVPEFNYEAMAEKLIYLLQNPKDAEKMGKAGRMNIEKLNNQQQRIASIKSLLFDCLT
jgi:colanic acid/amylovoran biosynthesis glycosyltransferase